MEETKIFTEPSPVVARERSVRLWVPFLIVGIVGLMTIAGGTILYRANRAVALTISSKDAELNQGLVHARGPADAKLTLEEYGDFQCPPCGSLAGPLKEIEERYSPHLRVIFHNFPLITHDHAHEAAQAAEAAGLQGKFWEMHDLLYREQSIWSKAADVHTLLSSYAGMIGLNLERFNKDIDSPEVKARVDMDQKKGSSLGVTNTPTLFLNGSSVAPNDLHPGNLEKVIKDTIENSEKPAAK